MGINVATLLPCGGYSIEDDIEYHFETPNYPTWRKCHKVVIIPSKGGGFCVRGALVWFKDSQREDFRGTGVERRNIAGGPFFKVHFLSRVELAPEQE